MSMTRSFVGGNPVPINRGTGVAVVAHRGGGALWNGYRGPFPEETLEAFEACRAAGVVWMNPHVCLLSDGTLALMHDATPDRTTDATTAVDVSNHTLASFKKLKVTPQNTTLWPGYGVNWGELHPPTVSEYLDRVGDKVMSIYGCARRGNQTNGQVAAALVAMLQARRLRQNSILQSFSAAELTPAAAAGFETMFLPPDLPGVGSDAAAIQASMTSASGWAAGKPKHVGVNAYPSGQTQAQVVTYIGTLVAAGFTVYAYGGVSRYDLAWLTAAGISFFCTDEPVYALTSTKTLTGTVDPLSQGVWPHGLLQADQLKGRGELVNGGVQLTYVTGNASTQFVCYGGFSPPANTNAYTVQADFVWDTLDADGTRHMDMVVCCPDDRPTSTVIGAGNGLVNGYLVLFRQNATSLVVSRLSQSAQTITGLLTQTTGLPSAPTAGLATTMRVQVTATQLIVTLIQSSTTYGPFTVTDSTHRAGGYFHLGKGWNSTPPKLVGTWKNITCG